MRFFYLLNIVMTIVVFALLSPSASAQQLPNGGVLAGEISVADEIDQFQFTGTAGEVVLIRVADTAGSGNGAFEPFVAVSDSSGDVLARGGSSTTGGLVAAIAIRLVADGQFTVSVSDDGPFNGANLGTYNIYFAKIPGVQPDAELSNGDEISGRIERGDIDSFVFDALAGETVFLRVADTETTEFINSPFTPTLILYGPDGDFIDFDDPSITGGLVARISTRLVEDGEYTVVVVDGSGTGNDSSGNYTLRFAKPPGSGNGAGEFLSPDDMVSNDIELGDIDLYRFSAFAGETVYLRAADTKTTEFENSGFTPFIVLYDPSGNLVSSDGTATTGGLVASLADQLVEDGTYTVVIFDGTFAGTQTGTYDLFYAKAPGSNEGGGISDGQVISGEIDLGDLDTFVFNAEVGTLVSITMEQVESGASLSPGITVLGPTGDPIVTDSGSTSAFVSFVTAESGLFTIVARDLGSTENNGVGEYTLTLAGEGVVGVAVECNGLQVTVDLNFGQTPGPGDDVVLGTPGDDDIRGRAGNDTICGGGGDDFIHGNSGDDWIDGGDGVDDIRGGQGNDTLFAGSGATAGTSSRVFGGNGDDSIFGGRDADDLRGGRGEDVISGEQGADLIIGNADNDTLFGGPGADDLRGGGGDNDELFGEGGGDTLNGGSGGNDFCDGGGQGGDTDSNCEAF